MKKRAAQFAVLLVACATLLAACAAPYNLGSADLKNESLVYYVNMLARFTGEGSTAYGRDTLSLVFDKTGEAGDFEQKVFSYDFADQHAVDSGLYSDRSWFQTSGARGTFTYSSKTHAFVATFSDVFAANPLAVGMTNGGVAASDYGYHDPAAIVSSSASNGVVTWTGSLLITPNNVVPVFAATGANGDTWVSESKLDMSYSVAGVGYTENTATTEIYTITGDTFQDDLRATLTSRAGTDTPETYTYDRKMTYSVQKTFLAGEATGENPVFSKLWVKGHTVVFQLEGTRYEEVAYTGSNAPTPPTVSPSDGTGITGTHYTVPWYYISVLPWSRSMTITNGDTFCYDGAPDGTSSRAAAELPAAPSWLRWGSR